MPSKVIIVTGASRGIGLAISHYLLKQSCRIVVVSRSKEPLEQLQSQYKEQVEVLAGDLADLSLGQKAVDAAVSRWGVLDGLIVNHGRLEPVERIADANLEEWRGAFDVNYFSAVAMVCAKDWGLCHMNISSRNRRDTCVCGIYFSAPLTEAPPGQSIDSRAPHVKRHYSTLLLGRCCQGHIDLGLLLGDQGCLEQPCSDPG